MFYLRGAEEIDLEVGKQVDGNDDEGGVQIFTRLEATERRRFSKGQRVSITASEFNEIAFACNYFVGELARKVGEVSSAVPAVATAQ